MRKHIELSFKINAYTIDTMPMGRLAEYMADLAAMLGEPSAVHFVRLAPGSTQVIHKIDYEAFPKVEDRVARLQTGEAAGEVARSYRSINRRLKEDNGDGALQRVDSPTAKIIEFPGVQEPVPITFEPVTQAGAIDGVVIRLGGKSDPVPVFVEARDVVYSKCLATRSLAKELGHHLFGGEMRFHGLGRWMRSDEGEWSLDRFTINHFEPLDQTPLSAVIAQLRDIPGADWGSVPDVWDELQSMRADDEGATS